MPKSIFIVCQKVVSIFIVCQKVVSIFILCQKVVSIFIVCQKVVSIFILCQKVVSIFIVCQKVVSIFIVCQKVKIIFIDKLHRNKLQCKIDFEHWHLNSKINRDPLIMPKSIFIVHVCQKVHSYCAETMQNSNSNLTFAFGA